MKTAKNISFCLLLFSLFFAVSHQTNAQENSTALGTITGHIQDWQSKAIPYLYVHLHKATDSSLVKSVAADSLGNFIIKAIPQGHYYVKVQLIGFKPTISQPFQIGPAHTTINLPPLTLQSNNTLETVFITGTRPLIEYKPGQTLVNLENTSMSAGNSLMDLLRKSPGVFVDQNDKISLNGKSGVMVMINGRPTHLSGDQLAAFLKNVPAGSVAKIALMDQPPAKYSAEGTAGIINIIMEKKVATGWNGSLKLGAGYGQFWKYNGGVNVNYGGKKLSFYANYNYKHQRNEFNMDMTRQFIDPNTNALTSLMTQSSQMEIKGHNQTAQLGMDYQIDDNQSIGFVLNGSFNNGDFNSFSPIHFLNASGSLDSISTSKNHNGYNWENEQGNLHYNLKLDDKGSALTANLDYSHFYQTSPQSIQTSIKDASGNTIGTPLKRRGKQPNDINIYAAKLDYTQVLKNNYKLSAGLKTSFVKTDNNSKFELNDNGSWENDARNTNHFIYKENVNAAYVSLDKTFTKGWSAKVGFRAEQANIKTNQVTTDSINEQHYIDLFPNITLSKTINPNNILSLSYTRRIHRPNYQSLNPFVFYVDEYTYHSGNPYLQPEYTNKFALTYTFKRSYNAVLSYSRTNDIMARVVRQNDITHIIHQTQDNISQMDNIRLSLSIPVTITKWWSTYNSAQFFYNRYEGLYNGFQLDKGFASFMLNTYQSFRIAQGWKAELTGMYRGASIMGPFKIDPIKMISIGVQKSLWNNRGSIKLNVQDVFQSMKFATNTDFGNLHLHNQFKLNDRAVNLTFTWNFGNQKVKVRKHKESSIKQQESRIQKGNGSGQGAVK